VVLILILAVACGGEDTSGLGKDYPTQLALISQNAHIQDRGLARELRSRLKGAPASERLDIVEVYVGQAARLYQDVVDALDDLQPPDGIQSAHTAYVQAWQARLELITKVRDAGFKGTDEYLRALDNRAFDETGHTTETTCEELQADLASAGRQVDLACAG
jgi:hypothetical protein